jgi:hypothetical protein
MKSELISPVMEQRAKAVKKGPTNSTIKNSMCNTCIHLASENCSDQNKEQLENSSTVDFSYSPKRSN